MTNEVVSLSALEGKMFEEFKALQEQVAKAEEEMRTRSKVLIEQACSKMFELCPEVHQVHWVQYTPYFNDGESCEFSVHDVFYLLTSDLDEDGEWDEEFYDGSSITTQDDVNVAKRKLKEAQKYAADPRAWRVEQYGEDMVAKGEAWIAANPGKSPNDYHSDMTWELRRVINGSPYPSDPAVAKLDLKKTVDQYNLFVDRGDVIGMVTEEVIGFIHGIDEDIMRAMFGDHVSVRITREGVDVEEYDHD